MLAHDQPIPYPVGRIILALDQSQPQLRNLAAPAS
jgi:hypothetical protein